MKKLKTIHIFITGLLLLLIAVACNSDYTVKRKGYFSIDFPKHEYQVFDQPGFPYTFEYPVYAKVVRDDSFFGDAPENPYWINIDFPRFNAKIYMSYKEIGKKNDFNNLVKDAFNLTYKHTTKATEIRDSLMHTKMGITGIFFHVGGEAATAKQFFVSDSVNHFLRGALYFDATPNEDSLSVVNDFLQTDMTHVINTLRWK